jgi:hypothetical protein
MDAGGKFSTYMLKGLAILSTGLAGYNTYNYSSADSGTIFPLIISANLLTLARVAETTSLPEEN